MNPPLGQIITAPATKDAVHVPIAPVRAGETLHAGDPIHFGIFGYAVRCTPGEEPIGVVDPFLDRPVHNGEDFWMLVRPGSIQGLRHEWTHPAFPAEAVEEEDNDDADGCRSMGCD